jgi:DMSO/TMAO reductase YedYZ molybdopterin-dependent catalytic subunit
LTQLCARAVEARSASHVDGIREIGIDAIQAHRVAHDLGGACTLAEQCPEHGHDAGIYYDAHPIEHMTHHLTMLAYDMNDAPLSFGHGAPLRLRNEVELGFKQVKWIKGIEFVAHYSEIGSGFGGYSQDHEFFGYRQSI